MPEELNRALGMEGGGYHIVIQLPCEACEGSGMTRNGRPAEEDDEEAEICEKCDGLGQDGERTYVLSDFSKGIQAEFIAWLKGRLRAQKIEHYKTGVYAREIKEADPALSDEQVDGQARGRLETELQSLDHHFAMGDYATGKPDWNDCIATQYGAAKLYQLLLVEKHPEIKEWSLLDIEALIELNPVGFQLALKDILPKAIREMEAAKKAARAKVLRSSRSPQS